MSLKPIKCKICRRLIYNLLNTIEVYCSVHCAIEGLIKRVKELENKLQKIK